MSTIIPATKHGLSRVRWEPKRRQLTVSKVWDMTPRMRRVELTSPDLADFKSLSPDDHLKLFVPDSSATEGISARDFTPRAFDTRGCTLVLDFALHDVGPATAWALAAKPGDKLLIGGPRGSTVLADDFDYYVLIGDETALPSIGRRVEGLRAGVPVLTVVVVDGQEEIQHFETNAHWQPRWVYRSSGVSDETALREAMSALTLPDGDGYVWIAAEARTARALRDYWLIERGHPRGWVKSSGYWVAGQPGKSDKLEG